MLDAGGHAIAVQRQDGASTGRIALATGKAAGALFLGVSSRKLADMVTDRPIFVASLGAIAPAGAVPAAGGIIVTDAGGVTIGAVGISGDLSDQDELCALRGSCGRACCAGLIACAGLPAGRCLKPRSSGEAVKDRTGWSRPGPRPIFLQEFLRWTAFPLYRSGFQPFQGEAGRNHRRLDQSPGVHGQPVVNLRRCLNGGKRDGMDELFDTSKMTYGNPNRPDLGTYFQWKTSPMAL